MVKKQSTIKFETYFVDCELSLYRKSEQLTCRVKEVSNSSNHLTLRGLFTASGKPKAASRRVTWKGSLVGRIAKRVSHPLQPSLRLSPPRPLDRQRVVRDRGPRPIQQPQPRRPATPNSKALSTTRRFPGTDTRVGLSIDPIYAAEVSQKFNTKWPMNKEIKTICDISINLCYLNKRNIGHLTLILIGCKKMWSCLPTVISL